MANIQEVKFYFQILTVTYSPDKTFEDILRKFKGRELDLKDHLSFAPVLHTALLGYSHVMDPIPNPRSWPKVASHEPFQIRGLDGKYILLFTGQIMDSNGKLKAGTCTSFDDIFLKLFPIRDIMLLKVPNDSKKIDTSLFRF